jgi:Tfp pilus assembly protein PilZ
VAQENRRNERRLVLKPVGFFLVPSIIGKTVEGLIMDISDSGLCLLTTSQLKVRQRIIIEDKSFSLEKVAVVRWIEKYDEMFYRIGLEYAKDQAFLNIRDKRRCKRLNVEDLNMNSEMAPANYIKITDMSIDGLSIETDKELDVGEEHVLCMQYEGHTLTVKGSVAWSTLKRNRGNNKADTVPVYKAGMRLSIPPDEMRKFIKAVKLKLGQKSGGKEKYTFLGLDRVNIH